MDRQYKVGDYNSRDYYTITFRIDDVRWAYVLKRIAKSKGLKKNITEFVFEHINYKKMQDSVYTDMKQNIDEIKNEKFFEINIQDILIEMLTTLKKTPNFHIKSLTIKGDDDLGEIGGIDNESFKILLDGLVSSRLCILSLWGMDIDQDKSNIISEVLNKRKAGKSKKVADFEIKITKCNIKDNFGFLSNIADGTQTISSISITHCGLEDDSMVALLRVLVKVKGLEYVNLSWNQLKDGCLDAFYVDDCSFHDTMKAIRFNLTSNKFGTSSDKRDENKEKLFGVNNIFILMD